MFTTTGMVTQKVWGGICVRFRAAGARSLVNEGDRSTFETSYASMHGQVCPFQTCVSRSGFLDKFQASSCDYAYLLTRHGAWLFANYNDRRFHSLKRRLKYND